MAISDLYSSGKHKQEIGHFASIVKTVNPPVSYDESIERLYTLTKMIYADNKVDKEQMSLLHKISTALSFPLDNVEKVCDEAIHLVINENDLEDFTSAIKKVNAV